LAQHQRAGRRVFLLTLGATTCMPPSWGANALLHPARRRPTERPAIAFEEVTFPGDDVTLVGWRFRAKGPRQGTVVYLHGITSHRASGVWIAERLAPRGFEVVAYDGRAHGDSTGEACTYGYYEKRDLVRVVDRLGAGPFILMGTSLGGAVALQAAAIDPRIVGVVAVATFSDLRTVANERAPFFASRANIDEALRLAEEKARFKVDEVSPVAAASAIKAPVLLIHGAKHAETPPDHSRRVAAALRTPSRLIVVPSAGHNDALTAEVWQQLYAWLAKVAAGEAR
jgi:pimeloyl-ACP methyl ester carboxylesterase